MPAMRISPEDPLLLRIVDDLAEKGWSQQNLFLPDSLTRELALECRKRAAKVSLHPQQWDAGLRRRFARGSVVIISSGWSPVRPSLATCIWS